MDPFTITSSVLKITSTCLSTAKDLNDIRSHYKDAPMTIVSICSETTTIGASLSHIQSLLLSKKDLEGVLQARQDLAAALDTALVGCAVLFSCLSEETERLTKGSIGPSTFIWKSKARLLWNHDRLKELLDGLRGQQTAINTLIQLLQVDSLSEIKRMLERNNDTFVQTAERTRSLREANPNINAPTSIYNKDDNEGSIYSTDISVIAPSEQEFDFDDQIVNSKVYRKLLAQAMAKGNLGPPVSVDVEGDLIDFSDEATLKARETQEETTEGAARLLEGLVMSNVDEVTRREPEITHASQTELPPQNQETPTNAKSQPMPRRKFSFEIEPSSSFLDTTTPLATRTSSDLSTPKQPTESTSPNQVASSASRPTIPKPIELRPPTRIDSTSLRPAAKRNSGTRICYKCKETLTGQFVRALDKTWHLECFNCADCGKIVATKFYPIDDDPKHEFAETVLCETDYFRRLNLLCHKCSEALRGSYITALGKKYHVDHFGCEICGVVFGAQDSYYEHQDGVYCHYDFCLKFAELCFGCTGPITKQFVEIMRDGQNQHWHPECYMIHKFWNVRVKTDSTYRRDRSAWKDANGVELSRQEVEDWLATEEARIYRIWTVLSAFEEECASWISDMLLHASNGTLLQAIQSTAGLLYAIKALFESLNSVVRKCLEEKEKLPAYEREAKLLCKKITAWFSLLANFAHLPNRPPRMGVTQELLSLVTATAHYLKLLIRIGLKKSMLLEQGSEVFVDQISTRYPLDATPNSMTEKRLYELLPPAWDCFECHKPVESACYVMTRGDLSDRRLHDGCVTCPSCKSEGKFELGVLLNTAQEFEDGSPKCSFCLAPRPDHIRFLNLLNLYSLLLWGALAQLAQLCQLPLSEVLKVEDAAPSPKNTSDISLDDIPRMATKQQEGLKQDPLPSSPLGESSERPNQSHRMRLQGKLKPGPSVKLQDRL